ncbi:MAG: ammonium transporter [Acidobacteriaceae bacterium]|nr:ammonium transporter [Acidobacteriaceae bacterium]
MTPEESGGFSAAGGGICLVFIFLVPFAAAGLSLINTGLHRSRSAAHSIVASLSVASVALLAYFTCGFAWGGLDDGPAHVINAGGKAWNWIGAAPFFLHGFAFDDSRASLIVLFQMLSAVLAAMIPLGSGAERWRLGAGCASTALLAGWTYPLFAHWVWSGGWLAQLGSNFGLGRGFLDPGGASCIQAVGGLTALSIAWILGARRGKFSPEGMPTAMPGHNAVIVLFGCMLALVGWMGLNSAGSILFAGLKSGQSVLVAVNTILCAASGGLTSLIVTRLRFGKPDASLIANGWVAGLAASSAACAFIKPAEAVLIGLVAGGAVVFSIEIVELRMRVDDPGGAISVHAVGGLWGVLAAGIFGRVVSEGTLSDSGQFLAQLVGVATLVGFVLPMTYGLNWLLNRFLPQRVASEGERQGMDLFELGAGAYPDFMTHREDLLRH